MSVRVMSLVWDSFPAGGSEMLVMLAMADWCNDEGLSLHPSNAAVSKKCRISKRQAQRIIDSLVCGGWLSVIGNSKGGAPGDTKQYRLNVKKLQETDDAGVTGDTGDTGDKNTQRRVTSRAQTGDICVTQTTIEPPIEPSIDTPLPPVRKTGSSEKPKREISKPAGVEAMRADFPDLPEEVALDFIAHRRAKRAPLTPSAWKQIAAEIRASGWGAGAALSEAMASGWQGVRAEWLVKRRNPTQALPTRTAVGQRCADAAARWLEQQEVANEK